MDYNLSRRIRLETEPKHKGLYGAALQELDEDGKVIGRDQIPWTLGLTFVATDLRVVSTYLVNEEEHWGRSSIRASLVPAINSRGIRPSFSMFGTDRQISDISLTLHPQMSDEEGANNSAFVSGWVSSTSNDPLFGDTLPDQLFIEMNVQRSEFDEIVRAADAGNISQAELRIHAQGIFSEWTPDIAVDQFKVLVSDARQQPIEGLVDQELPFNRLGKARSVSFSIARNLSLQSAIEEEEEFDQEGWSQEPDDDGSLLDSTAGNAAPDYQLHSFVQLRAIKFAAWAIALLLLIGLFIR